jgi:hypothetical protein
LRFPFCRTFPVKFAINSAIWCCWMVRQSEDITFGPVEKEYKLCVAASYAASTLHRLGTLIAISDHPYDHGQPHTGERSLRCPCRGKQKDLDCCRLTTCVRALAGCATRLLNEGRKPQRQKERFCRTNRSQLALRFCDGPGGLSAIAVWGSENDGCRFISRFAHCHQRSAKTPAGGNISRTTQSTEM